VTPSSAIDKARAGDIGPVVIVAGPEVYLVEQVVSAIRAAVFAGNGAAGLAPFNEDKFTAGEAPIDRILSAARLLPMMLPRRLVVVRGVERWDVRTNTDSGSDDDDSAAESSTPTPSSPPARNDKDDALDRLATYAENPSPTTCLVLSGSRLDSRRRLALLAKKKDFLVVCEPLARADLPNWIVGEARARGHAMSREVADELAEIAGPELSYVVDALERLSLYVGTGAPITQEAIELCVVRLRQSTVWELVGAVGRRDLGAALAALDDVYDPRDRGLRLLGLLAWSVRQLIRFDAASRAGASPEEAARRAGAPPFKARELAGQVRKLPSGELVRWLQLLSETDLALKGSRRLPRATLETAVIDMCRTLASAE
jgi:DNA polymerase-3 subunit delta